MKHSVELILPWPPTVNKLWATTRHGKWYETKFSKDFKEFVIYYARAKRLIRFKPTDEIFFQLIAYPPDKKRRDLDNLTKVVCDALEQSNIIENDCQIKRIYMEMREIRKGGAIHVILENIIK